MIEQSRKAPLVENECIFDEEDKVKNSGFDYEKESEKRQDESYLMVE
jgi:hypothetical protein